MGSTETATMSSDGDLEVVREPREGRAEEVAEEGEAGGPEHGTDARST